MKMRKRKEILWSVGFILFGFVLAFILGEVCLRVIYPNNIKLYKPDPVLGWKQIPNARGWISSPGEYRTWVEINSKGLRDKEYDYRSRYGVFRILVLGDSFAQAVQVPLEEAFHSILEQRLNSSKKPFNFEVINAGVGGYNTELELLLLKEEGFRYQPNIVLLTFLLANDTLDNYKDTTYGNIPRTRFKLENGRLVEVPVLRKFAETDSQNVNFKSKYFNSALIGQFVGRLKALPIVAKAAGWIMKPLPPRMNEIYKPVYTPETEAAWALTEALIVEMEMEVRNHGAKLIVLIWPDNVQFDDVWWARRVAAYPAMANYDRDKGERVMTEILNRNGISFISLTPILRKATEERLGKLFFPVDQHPTAKAHAIVGEAIYQYLQRSDILFRQ